MDIVRPISPSSDPDE
ncbi:hypothetical protein AZE42_05366 [Rhizopogon vesiculosus]|uniref:Uncharacterized protein n=1 Tax=Rhizopogon vesiculosus TaxID=180088 RepID=A0A1J8RFM6_9AGAM|nr:hypothetical protein AZE42_05366 [Rhizopogon vesiculosus]